MPTPDGFERLSVCADPDGEHRHRIVPGSTFLVDDELVGAKDDWTWPSYCGLCHIARGHNPTLLKRLQAAGAVERV